MPYKSAKQKRLMQAVAHNPKFAKKVGIPQSVGRKFEAHKAEGGRVRGLKSILKPAQWRRLEHMLDLEPKLDKLLAPRNAARLVRGRDPLTVMDPDMFLNLASHGDILDIERRGRALSPFIKRVGLNEAPELAWNSAIEEGMGIITGHDGRGRSDAFRRLGSKIPVRMPWAPAYYDPFDKEQAALFADVEDPTLKEIYGDALTGRMPLADALAELDSIKKFSREDKYLPHISFEFNDDEPMDFIKDFEHFADGGKVRGSKRVMDWLAMLAERPLSMPRNSADYGELVRQMDWNPVVSPHEFDVMSRTSFPNLTPAQIKELDDGLFKLEGVPASEIKAVVDKFAVPVPPRTKLYRGMSLMDPDLRKGDTLSHTGPFSTTLDGPLAHMYAEQSSYLGPPHLFRVATEEGVRGMPRLFMSQDEIMFPDENVVQLISDPIDFEDVKHVAGVVKKSKFADGGKVGTVRQLAQSIRDQISRGRMNDLQVRHALMRAAEQADVPVGRLYSALQEARPQKAVTPPPKAPASVDHPLVAPLRAEHSRLLPPEGFRPSMDDPAMLEQMNTMSLLANRQMDRANVNPTFDNIRQIQEFMRQLSDAAGRLRKAKGGKVSGAGEAIAAWLRRIENIKDRLSKGYTVERAEIDGLHRQAEALTRQGYDVNELSRETRAPTERLHAEGGKVSAVTSLFQIMNSRTRKPAPGSFADPEVAEAIAKERQRKTTDKLVVEPVNKARGGPVNPKRRKSNLGTVSQLAAAAGGGSGKNRQRLIQGLMSQLYATDRDGNLSFLMGRPSIGTTPEGGLDVDLPLPGIINEVLALPTLAESVGLGPAPSWATRASARADETARRVQMEMGLDESAGFGENFDVALGSMLAQIPVPTPKKATKIGKLLEKAAESAPGSLALGPLEYILPTIQPSLKNYLTGGLGGGAIRSGQDLVGEPTE